MNGDVDVCADTVSPVWGGCADAGNGGERINGDVGGFCCTAEYAGGSVIGSVCGVVSDSAIAAGDLIPGGKGNGVGDGAVETWVGYKSEAGVGVTG